MNGIYRALLSSSIWILVANLAIADTPLEKQAHEDLLLERIRITEGSTTGPERLVHVDALIELGRLRMDAGNYTEASTLLRRAMEVHTSLFDGASTNDPGAIGELGVATRLSGAYSTAIVILTEALETATEILGSDDPRLAIHHNDLAIAYEMMGEHGEALAHHVRALDLRDGSTDIPSKGLAFSLNNLGGVLVESGRYDVAGPMLEEADRVARQVLELDDPDLAAILCTRASYFLATDELEHALRLYHGGLEIREKALGKTHPAYVANLNNLGFVYETMGDLLAAEQHYVEAMTLWRDALGGEPAQFATIERNLQAVRQQLDAAEE